jgi:hypothetical protein
MVHITCPAGTKQRRVSLNRDAATDAEMTAAFNYKLHIQPVHKTPLIQLSTGAEIERWDNERFVHGWQRCAPVVIKIVDFTTPEVLLAFHSRAFARPSACCLLTCLPSRSPTCSAVLTCARSPSRRALRSPTRSPPWPSWASSRA